jgi:hypothetical protein
MNIKIEQTLHGYETGHQLLMSSTPLSNDAKLTLLVQSDLSGSNVDESFKNYITGYPLSSHYALSKTWYADEMRRPGCVWTQTFLIAFADLGKIPDLSQITKYFKRPIKDQYEEYSSPIVLERAELENTEEVIEKSVLNTKILSAVYEKYDRTILLPSNTSKQFESVILQLWSNQWPRLRRNFYFCTGALSLKSLDGREFDLQVVPRRNILSIEKQTQKAFVVDVTNLNNQIEGWISLLYNSNKNSLRRFLWLYGSDVIGNRKNLIPLLQIYGETLNRKSDFQVVNELIYNSFSSQSEAVRLKGEVYSDNNLFHFDKRQVLSYLLNSKASQLKEIGAINLNERLIDAYKSKLISFYELVDLYLNADPERVSEEIWDSLISNGEELLTLISRDERLLTRFASRLPELTSTDEIWYMPFNFQLKLIESLNNANSVDWEKIIDKVLNSKSEIIFEILKHNPRRIMITLRWMDANNYTVIQGLESKVFTDYKGIFSSFVKENYSSLSSQTCNKIFQNLNVGEIQSVGLDAAKWISIYRKISSENTKIFASCVLLAFGFNRRIGNPAGIVLNCFSDVYYYAKASKVEGINWEILPVDMSEEEDEGRDAFSVLFSILNLFSAKKTDIPYWDHCELLVRTLVNKFIKYKWPNQAFLECLNTEHLTEQAITYCLSFKKGSKFIEGIFIDIQKRKIKPNKHQIHFINIVSHQLK